MERIAESLPPRPAESTEYDTAEQDEPWTPDGFAYCGTCAGYRWLRVEVPLSSRDFGQVRRCPDCIELDRAHRLARLAKEAGLSAEQRSKTFQTFRPNKGVDLAVRAAAAFAKEPVGWLVIHGKPGSGKTHLSLAVANALVAVESPVRWWYAPDLVDEMRSRVGQDGSYHGFLLELRQAPVLLLDDLGAVRPTDYAISDVLEPLFDYRYRHRLATLVTAIAAPSQLKELVSESIARRMEDTTICRVIANEAPQWAPPDAHLSLAAKKGA